MNCPSIFNDVVGPVMRGPSSSHCAAALRIGRLCRDLMDGHIDDVLIEFDPKGSLATTHDGHGSDMGLFGGLLGWEAYDDRLPESEKAIQDAGITVAIEIVEIGFSHPNTYKITLKNDKETRQVVAISTGGGMIEVIEIDGASVSMAGDYFETLIYVQSETHVVEWIETSVEHDEVGFREGAASFVELKSQEFPSEEICVQLEAMDDVIAVKRLSPVLPVLSRQGLEVPFANCEEMLRYNKDKDLALWELAVHYESARGNITGEDVFAKMAEIVGIMQTSINRGLEGTVYEDRILGSQSVNFERQMKDKKLIEGDVLNRVILFVTAMMEIKSSMGVIVAAPTAGSCGALPGAVLGVALNQPEEEAVKAMLAAGIIGVFIATNATFAAEVGGCQAECGSGSGMAAAAIVSLGAGTLGQSLSAASMALQNSLGLICDPIGNRVEAPCLGRNVQAAANALSCANMALADYDHLIPLDQVIDTMDKVGESIVPELRCTSLGGLSITPASVEIEEQLKR
ncbi:MAG: serine dehydratase [Candidatus Latescibacteria bacterium]|jgi:L-serine dehydratase|nr:serine dehydratase [Candidatus Latescibacterota bacterium]MBT5829991.1 serine dehydratase [Candidatus Latescibacterota bacterium]